MLPKFLTKVEEKYVFKLSTFVWHFIIGISSLAALAGLLLLIWGIIPSIKKNVEKAQYPPVEKINLEEVLNEINPPAQVKNTPEPSVTQTQQSPLSGTDKDATAYNSSIEKMQKLIPPPKYTWAPQGYYNYWNEWVVYNKGLFGYLDDIYRDLSLNSYGEKKQLIDQFNIILAKFKEEKRPYVISPMLEVCTISLAQSISNLQLLTKSTAIFPPENTDYVEAVGNFIKNNPTEGVSFIEYCNNNLVKFHADNRYSILRIMIRYYYSNYNNKFQQQKEITDLFLPMLAKLNKENQVKAFDIYNNLSVNKNRQREYRINEIESSYQVETMQAELDYQASRVKKAENRVLGLYGLGSGIITVAFIALMLVLLSIQRYIKKIEGKIELKTENKIREVQNN